MPDTPDTDAPVSRDTPRSDSVEARNAASEDGHDGFAAKTIASMRSRARQLKALATRAWPHVRSSHYFLPAAIFVIGMLVFALGRMALLIVYHEDFLPLGVASILFAFFKGALFDASILLVFIGLPLILLTIPMGWAASRWFRLIAGWYSFAALAVMAFTLAGDIVYFEEVHRHAGPETWAVGNDFRILAVYAFDEHLISLVAIIILLSGLGYAWHRMLKMQCQLSLSRRRGALISVAVFIVVGFTIRGGVRGKPINVVNAFDGVSLACGNLILNGPFTLGHSIRHAKGHHDVEWFPREEAVKELRRALDSSDDEWHPDLSFPLLRTHRAKETNSPNIIVILLESWSAVRVDALRRTYGATPLGATPQFDALCKEGTLFTRFYSAGQRSIHGIAAILTGYPPLPGQPYLGVGLEQNQFPYIGNMAKHAGYSTYFMQGSPRQSYRCDAISSMAGFDNYFGEEDVKVSDHSDHRHPLGAWDYDLLMGAAERFKSAPRPFLGFIFTLSSHGPFDVPSDEFRKFPDSISQKGYLNSLYYSDWALGQFLEKAKAEGFFDDTVFIVTADHSKYCPEFRIDVSTRFHIPCLVIGPGIPRRENNLLGSHLDLFPTMMDIAGWSERHSSAGRSLFDDERPEDRFAMCARVEMTLRVENTGWVLHDLTARRDNSTNTPEKDLESIERHLKIEVQALTLALRENKVYRPDDAPSDGD